MSMPYGKIADPSNFSMDTSSNSRSHHHGDTDEMDGSHGELGNREQLRGLPYSFLSTYSMQEHLTQSNKSVPVLSKSTALNCSFPLHHPSSYFQTTL